MRLPGLFGSLLGPLCKWVAVCAASTVLACSAVSDSRVRAGLGAPCQEDGDCHASRCIAAPAGLDIDARICAIGCAADLDCPSPTVCADQRCQMPLSVGVVLSGSVNELEGITYAHNQALTAAEASLGYVRLQLVSDVRLDQADEQLERLAQSSQVVLATARDYGPSVLAAAARHPDVRFLWVGDGVEHHGSAGATSYWVRIEQAYYVAGQIAATIGKRRIGVVSGTVGPDSVRRVNALLLGARSIDPGVVVEVRHLGAPADFGDRPRYAYRLKSGKVETLYREELLTVLLADAGADLIVQMAGNQRAVRYLDKLAAAGLVGDDVSIFASYNPDGWLSLTGTPYRTAVGSIYESFTLLYKRLFERVHRGAFDPREPIEVDLDDTPDTAAGISVSRNGRLDIAGASRIQTAFARAKGPGPRERVFAGPYATSGQRDRDSDGIPDPAASQRVEAGAMLPEPELSRMCFYVDGVVEKQDLEDPGSADQPARVPGGLRPGATTPGDTVPLPTGTYGSLLVPAGSSGSCRENAIARSAPRP